jgi:hypothetical protein
LLDAVDVAVVVDDDDDDDSIVLHSFLDSNGKYMAIETE